MASRSAFARSLYRRFSSGSGKILSEEEKAAENVYIKKVEKEKLEKLAHKGVKQEAEQASAAKVAPEAELKPRSPPADSSTTGVSTDKNRNYAVLAGTVAVLSAFGWYQLSKSKKTQEVQD